MSRAAHKLLLVYIPCIPVPGTRAAPRACKRNCNHVTLLLRHIMSQQKNIIIIIAKSAAGKSER